MLRFLLPVVVALAPFGKTAFAQYVQVSTNALALGYSSPNLQLEFPLNEFASLETSIIYVPSSYRNLFDEARFQGWRGSLSLKHYLSQSEGLHDGFFLGAYLRYSSLSVQERAGSLFTVSYDAHQVRKTALGVLFGYSFVGRQGLYFSIGGGVGGLIDRSYHCQGVDAGSEGEDCGINGIPFRDQTLNVYLQTSFGWRVRSKSDQFRKLRAELAQKQHTEELQRLRQQSLDDFDTLDLQDSRYDDLTPVQAKRLKRRTEYRLSRSNRD